ncbi:MAG: murein L,D-transpeptidase YcbB/YkuD, partial [Myxococcota bacterium]
GAPTAKGAPVTSAEKPTPAAAISVVVAAVPRLAAKSGRTDGRLRLVLDVYQPVPLGSVGTYQPSEAFTAALQPALKRVAFRSVVKQVYARSGNAPRFFDGLKPAAAAGALVELVTDLPSHDLDPGLYKLSPSVATTATSIAEAAERDVLLTAAVVRYVMDFQFIVRSHPQDLHRNIDAFADKKAEAIADAAHAVFPNVVGQLAGLWPKRPEYAALRKALPVWREKARTHGKPPKVKVLYRTLEAGAKGKKIKQIQERLAYDGTYLGPINSLLDPDTMAALARFQARNGLTADGKPGRDTSRVLNIKPRIRVAQIRASLHRWRESKPRRQGLDTYLRVNVAGFHLELFEKGKRTRVHRTIVGNNKLDYNRKRWRQGYINRTPLLETRMDKVVVNPTWIVPPRIRDLELGPAQAKDGSYFRRHGFRTRQVGDKTVVVQSSGSHNVLGQVKFLLHRTNAIYLHDTNKRHLFDRDSRAMSHGCMRVDGATDLARHVLTSRTGMKDAEFTELLANSSTRTIKLDEPLIVFVEYISTGIDKAGELVLYQDIYGYDAKFGAGKLPTYNDTRYGSGSRRPRAVPRIPHAEYRKLKAQGGLAPTVWPPDEG